jgi:hypothetical protein
MPGRKRAKDFFLGHRHGGATVSLPVAVDELALHSHLERDWRSKSTNAQFRTLQIGQDAKRTANHRLSLANGKQPALMILVTAMTEVEPKDVGALVGQQHNVIQRV